MGRTKELWYLLLRNFWSLLPKSYLSKGNCALSSISLNVSISLIFNLSNISADPKFNLADHERTCKQYFQTRCQEAPLYVWWIEPILKSYRVSKYYAHDCLKSFILLSKSLIKFQEMTFMNITFMKYYLYDNTSV